MFVSGKSPNPPAARSRIARQRLAGAANWVAFVEPADG